MVLDVALAAIGGGGDGLIDVRDFQFAFRGPLGWTLEKDWMFMEILANWIVRCSASLRRLTLISLMLPSRDWSGRLIGHASHWDRQGLMPPAVAACKKLRFLDWSTDIYHSGRIMAAFGTLPLLSTVRIACTNNDVLNMSKLLPGTLSLDAFTSYYYNYRPPNKVFRLKAAIGRCHHLFLGVDAIPLPLDDITEVQLLTAGMRRPTQIIIVVRNIPSWTLLRPRVYDQLLDLALRYRAAIELRLFVRFAPTQQQLDGQLTTELPIHLQAKLASELHTDKLLFRYGNGGRLTIVCNEWPQYAIDDEQFYIDEEQP